MSASLRTRRDDCDAFVTKDGSLIRELMHPGRHAVSAQSLAEATVAVGEVTALHRHRRTEELYHVLEGRGRMTLGEQQFEVTAGDTISIAPGTPHRIMNIGTVPLRLLCCCAPAYTHEDTELLPDGD